MGTRIHQFSCGIDQISSRFELCNVSSLNWIKRNLQIVTANLEVYLSNFLRTAGNCNEADYIFKSLLLNYPILFSNIRILTFEFQECYTYILKSDRFYSICGQKNVSILQILCTNYPIIWHNFQPIRRVKNMVIEEDFKNSQILFILAFRNFFPIFSSKNILDIFSLNDLNVTSLRFEVT